MNDFLSRVESIVGPVNGDTEYAWKLHWLMAAPLAAAMLWLGFTYGFWGETGHKAFKALRGEYPAVTLAMRAVSDFSAAGLYAVYGAILLFALYKKDLAGRTFSLRFLLGMLVFALCLTKLLKLGFGMPRPGYPLPPMPFSFRHSYASFPSGHTVCIVASAIPLAFWLARRSGYVLAAALMLAVGCSRIWLGAHHPVDILAGILVGGLAARYISLAREPVRGRSARGVPQAAAVGSSLDSH